MGAHREGVDASTRVVSVLVYNAGQQTERWPYPDDLAAWNGIFDV